MKYTYLYILLLLINTNCSVLINNKETNCKCKKIYKAYRNIEEQISDERYYYFGPEKPVTFFADGTQTTPPKNKNISIILNCTDIKFNNPSKHQYYYVDEDKLEEIKMWIETNCPE